MFARLLQTLCQWLKHYVLAAAHPRPESILVYPGHPGTIEHAMITSLANSMAMPELVLCVDDPGDDEGIPCLMIDDYACVRGWMTVCRYLGSEWRLLPVDPHARAYIDEALELLQGFVAPIMSGKVRGSRINEHVAVFAGHLDQLFPHDDVCHIHDFDADTLADVCWVAALEYVSREFDSCVSLADRPGVRSWMHYQSTQRTPTDDTDSEDGIGPMTNVDLTANDSKKED